MSRRTFLPQQNLLCHFYCSYGRDLRLSIFERDLDYELTEIVRLKSWNLWQNVFFKKFEHFLSVGSVNDVSNVYFVIKNERDEIMLNSKTFSGKFCSTFSLASVDSEEFLEERLQKLPKTSSSRSLPDLQNSQELVEEIDSLSPRHHKKSSTLPQEKKPKKSRWFSKKSKNSRKKVDK